METTASTDPDDTPGETVIHTGWATIHATGSARVITGTVQNFAATPAGWQLVSSTPGDPDTTASHPGGTPPAPQEGNPAVENTHCCHCGSAVQSGTCTNTGCPLSRKH